MEDEMSISSDRYPWYALHVRSQHEKIVASTLRGKGMRNSCHSIGLNIAGQTG